MALSIKTKIWLPAIALSIGLVLMSTGSAVRTVKSQAITVKEQSDQQSKLELASRWRGLVEAQALRTLGAALASDEASAALLQGGQEQALQELTQVQSSLSALLTDTMERAALEAATSQAQALKASLDAAQKLKAAGDAAALQAHIQGDTQGKLKALQSAQQDMVRLTERGATELRDKAGNERLNTVWGVAGIMAIIIAAVCIGTRLVQRSVTEPLADIVQVTRSIGEGDLTVRIVTDRQDEMGEVLRALAQMSNSLAELVGQVQRSAGSIGAASVEIAHGTMTCPTAPRPLPPTCSAHRPHWATSAAWWASRLLRRVRLTRWRPRPTPWRKAAASRSARWCRPCTASTTRPRRLWTSLP